MNRRQALQLLAGISVLATPLFHRLIMVGRDDTSGFEPALIRILGDEHLVKRIGNAYRRRYPGESSGDSLLGLLTGENLPEGRTGITIGNDKIDEMIRNDFRDGRIVIIEGWVLSRTEARQSALFSLVAA